LITNPLDIMDFKIGTISMKGFGRSKTPWA